MGFATNLQGLLARRRMKAVNLCAALSSNGVEVSLVTVQRWLDGTTEPQAAHLRAIADALGISLDELYPSQRPTAAGAAV